MPDNANPSLPVSPHALSESPFCQPERRPTRLGPPAHRQRPMDISMVSRITLEAGESLDPTWARVPATAGYCNPCLVQADINDN